MRKSAFAANLDRVQAEFTAVLRPLGFRKNGRTYNRPTSDGLTQVVNLQIRRPDPIPPRLQADQPPPGHDSFTVNLGVWIPEVSDYHRLPPRSKTIQEYDCQVRARLGMLRDPPQDRWWPLDASWPSSAADAIALLHHVGLPFLDRFGQRDGVVADWAERAPDGRIVVAIIEARRGHLEEARRLLLGQIADTEHDGHREYVRSMAARLGLGAIVPH